MPYIQSKDKQASAFIDGLESKHTELGEIFVRESSYSKDIMGVNRDAVQAELEAYFKQYSPYGYGTEAWRGGVFELVNGQFYASISRQSSCD